MAAIQIEQIPYYLTWAIRHKVMYPELTIEDVKLDNDVDGLHFGLYLDGKLTSILSLFEQGPKIQLRKFATLTEQQGNGYGKQLMQYTVDFAAKMGASTLWCNARVNVLPFYKNFGFNPVGPTWETLGHTFIVIEKLLNESKD